MENRLGMFVHWGIYALTGYQEQALARLDMDRAAYEGLADRFDPRKYDPEKWVLLAKEAGMEYICFTAKHHDGFCMWDTAETDYKITNTPYGKDVLKMLAEACRKHGMRLSIYYSCPDWHHENGYNPAATHQWKAKTENGVNTKAYLGYVKAQITELMTNYGPIYTLFWDIPPKIKAPEINETVRALQPGIFINDRGYDTGDFSTPEREYQTSEGTRFTRMTEACNALGEQSWGYRANEDYHSFRYLTSAIDKMMAMGASYLLNVGPNAEGEIPAEQVALLRRVGDWYNRMEGCLKNHESDDFNYRLRGNAVIVIKKEGKSYFHFYNGLRSSAVALQYFPTLPKRVRLLNTKEALPFAIERLPEYFSNGQALPHLHIRGIPVDDLAAEPIVLEVEW